MNKIAPIIFLIIAESANLSFGQVRSKKAIAVPHSTTSYLLTPQKMTPLSFLATVRRSKDKNFPVTMVNYFPKNWVVRKDVDSLMKLINSQQKCNCIVNPVSSYTPSDGADLGGYATWLIESYRQKTKLKFGLFVCPKSNKAKVAVLTQWWKSQ